MRNTILKKAPNLETEEEAARFWLTHDTTDYVDWDKAEQPNLQRAEHVVTIPIPDDEYGQLNELAAARKKSLSDTIGLLIHRSLKELRTNPSARL